jgi:hypothetical protein
MTSTISFAAISGEELQFLRSKAEVDVTMTIVLAASHAYPNSGLVDTSGFGAAWAVPFNIRPSFVQVLTPLRNSTFEIAYPFEIDLTNRTVVLYAIGAATTDGAPLSEVPDTTVLTNGTYTARIRIRGT